jgi:hypothetical protein
MTMTDLQLRNWVGLFLVIAQFSLIAMVLILWASTRFLFEEMTTTIALLTPMFAIYTTSVVKHLISHRNQTGRPGHRVSPAFSFISFFFPCAFVAGLAAMIWLKSRGSVFASMEQFKTALGIVQTSFAVYLGLLINSLFDSKVGAARRQ